MTSTLLGRLGRAVDRTSHRPTLIDNNVGADRQRLVDLLSGASDVVYHDHLREQIAELIACRAPSRRLAGADLDAAVRAYMAGRSPAEVGVFVFYPWSRDLVHVLGRDDYRELRSSRNRYKILDDEQRELANKTIGIVGLSVGFSIAVALVLEGTASQYRLADFDALSVSNMNRLPHRVADVGVNKAVLAARRMSEIDPFVDIVVFSEGITDTNEEAFFLDGGRIDLLIEECDALYVKVKLRQTARRLGIPVVMDTNDRGLLDIERFDLEPERPVLHGLIGDIDASALRNLATRDKAPFLLQILGEQTMSPRLAASLLEVDETIAGWPQLASSTMLGGGIAADAARRILLGQLRESGRYYVDVDTIVADGRGVALDRPTADVSSGRLATTARPRIATRQDPDRLRGGVSEQHVREIVDLGIRAPSGGNAQPWAFRLAEDGHLICRRDAVRSQSILDFEHGATHAALGAAVENMTLAARARGYDIVVAPFPDVRDTLRVCDLSFVRSGAMPPDHTALLGAAEQRATNRRLGDGSRLDEGPQRLLGRAAAERGARLRLITSRDDLTEIGAILGAVDRIRILSSPLHAEMMSELRWSMLDAETSADGIDVGSLELDPADIAGLRLIRNPKIADLVRGIGGGGGLERLARRSISSSSAVALLTVPAEPPVDHFLGGRALEHVWLTATTANLAIHPWSAAPYLFARAERGRGVGLPAWEIGELAKLAGRYKEIFGLTAGEAEILLFRISVAPSTTTRSRRWPVDAVLTVEG